MNATPNIDNDQARLWNGAAGRAWVDAQEPLDQMLQPFEDLLVQAVRTACGRDANVLDVGCGTGSTTIAIERELGSQGSCSGIDISSPLIAAARVRAECAGSSASFTCGDAQTHVFEPAIFDMIVSRFGVMFFDDPVRAFAKLRGAIKEDGKLALVAWRGAAENPFMTTAERAAAPLVPSIPARRANGPGQFAFADRDRVRTILEASGWNRVHIQPVDVTCTLQARDLTRYLSRLGPLGLILDEMDAGSRSRIVETVRKAFEPYVHGDEVRFTGACWMIEAKAALP